jgi:hypothetical protein
MGRESVVEKIYESEPGNKKPDRVCELGKQSCPVSNSWIKFLFSHPFSFIPLNILFYPWNYETKTSVFSKVRVTFPARFVSINNSEFSLYRNRLLSIVCNSLFFINTQPKVLLQVLAFFLRLVVWSQYRNIG